MQHFTPTQSKAASRESSDSRWSQKGQRVTVGQRGHGTWATLHMESDLPVCHAPWWLSEERTTLQVLSDSVWRFSGFSFLSFTVRPHRHVVFGSYISAGGFGSEKVIQISADGWRLLGGHQRVPVAFLNALLQADPVYFWWSALLHPLLGLRGGATLDDWISFGFICS